MNADTPVRPDDMEAARLLREIAGSPRQGIIWAQYHGGWAGNTADALTRGADALDAQGDGTCAVLVRTVRDQPGEMVGIVLEKEDWPPHIGLALLDAAEALEPRRRRPPSSGC